ncbi:NAD(P)-dependent oxidoreductase [Noviherbaspirillum saxi]|uniref:NAD(P)-dependent oxidoreductase n=1 Tax=Noviherbaspirillum saxi TaxID=2320863 RepID=A0A3A3FRH8_9BURK|nr:NAD(P)-dependent oxidoreductase [Noviherbaspirillum saxi]RJF98646.1 NAD(P)-dependent oxidoreductase [Noviherbaspirillum saxi]
MGGDMRVGLIGAGLMGRGMGHRLIAAGHSLGVVAHHKREVIDELVAAGAREFATPAALARESDAVITCLPGTAAVEAVLFDADGAAGAARGLLVIDCSTSLPDASRDFAKRLQQQGHAFVDAPVTGGPAEAMNGQLLGLVGGEPETIERARPLLTAFCESLQVFGGIGCGHAAKLINNGLGFGILGVVSEVIATALQQRLDMPALLAMIARSGGQNRVLQGLTPWLLEGDASRPQVTVATAFKDVDYYLQLARGAGTAGPVFETVLAELRRAIDDGHGPRMLPAYPASIAARAGIKAAPER